jgi:hypothetical protein
MFVLLQNINTVVAREARCSLAELLAAFASLLGIPGHKESIYHWLHSNTKSLAVAELPKP